MSDKPPLVEHWDDKFMRDTTNSRSADEEANVDRASIAVRFSGQLVDKQSRGQPTRGQTNSWTGQFVDKPIRGQTNSWTNQIVDKPTRVQYRKFGF